MRRAIIGIFALALAAPVAARAHEERPTRFPDGDGRVPTYRTGGPALVVCKPDSHDRILGLPEPVRSHNLELLSHCAYAHVQAAIDAVSQPGSRILVLPGAYLEEPSLAPPEGECAELAEKEEPYTYAEHLACPHNQNLIAIMGDADDDFDCDPPLCDLQVEGTGARPLDVLIDGGFRKLNVLRADRADGVYFRNLTVQRATFNALYVIETDGFAIDRAIGRWNDEYGFLTFSSDHGLYIGCEAYGNGDSGLYPGSAADHHGARPAIEITRCRSHHNTLGYSGTAGNSVFAHHNVFDHNATGASMDSFFPDHPGLPQDSATFTENLIFSNNLNYYRYYADGTCAKPYAERGYEDGVVCPSVPVPVGTGIILAGGNANTFARNQIYDNWRFGTMQFWVPAILRNETDPAKLYDTSHFNRYLANTMGRTPRGERAPNGLDFWWDEEGAGNCWSGNGPGPITSDPPALPDCDAMPVFTPGSPAKQALLVPCATWSRDNPFPPGCDWMETPDRPE